MPANANIMLQECLPLPRANRSPHHTFPSLDDAIDLLYQHGNIPILRAGNYALGIFFWVFHIGIRRRLARGMGGFGSGVWVRGGKGRGVWDEFKAGAFANVFDLVFGGLDVLIEVEGFACEKIVVGALLEFALVVEEAAGLGS